MIESPEWNSKRSKIAGSGLLIVPGENWILIARPGHCQFPGRRREFARAGDEIMRELIVSARTVQSYRKARKSKIERIEPRLTVLNVLLE